MSIMPFIYIYVYIKQLSDNDQFDSYTTIYTAGQNCKVSNKMMKLKFYCHSKSAILVLYIRNT